MGRESGIAKLRRGGNTDALAERKALLDQMTPELREKFRELQGRIADQSAENVKFYHSLGKSLLEISKHPDKYLTAEQLADKIDPVDLLEQVMSTTRDSMRKAAVFAEQYETDDLHRLLKYRSDTDHKFRLHWGHVVYLLTVPSKPQRIKFEELAVKECFTPLELHKAIQKHFGGARSKGGRPLAIPRTLGGQLNQIKDMSTLWLRRNAEVWNGDKHSVFANLMSQPPDSFDQETLTKVQQIRQTLDEVSRHALEDVTQADRTIEYIQTALSKSKPAAAPGARQRPSGRQKPTSRAAATATRLTKARPVAR
jgi:hypothetical protein